MRQSIKNRKGLEIVLHIKKSESPKGTAIVMHGLGGYKEQPHIERFAKSFEKSGYTVVTFDTTNSIGESGGKMEDAKITTYYQDLEDVITWVEKQSWFAKPFVLSGHSLGGFSVAFYAENYPSKVFAIAPISPFVSGKMSVEAHNTHEPEEFKKWEETGWQIKESNSKPEVIKKLPWSHIADRLKYNLLEKIEKLTMPVLLIVGEDDTSTPPQHVQVLYDNIPSTKKEIHIIKNAPHTFKDSNHLEEIEKLFLAWIEKLK
ncbi:alpha/beta hydrolase [Candidatus Woesebacteria bacterium]|nr:alpha/beta hydrolase [Candidatus Woesebacteria bacterium]